MHQSLDFKNPVFVAVDTANLGQAVTLAHGLSAAGGLKLGLEFFTAHGPQGVRALAGTAKLPVFLDLKLHDIPNTVAGAVRSVTAFAPSILTVHAAGGRAMLRAAVEAARDGAEQHGVPRPQIVAVTVLTSLDEGDLGDIGVDRPVDEQVKALAGLAADCGLDGVVASPHEAAGLRAAFGPSFRLVIPGVRPPWAEAGDQKRVMTPQEARDAGADVLVIGRPITGAADPAAALTRILGELS